MYYSLRRSGVSLLRELVTRCRRNQQLLLGDGLAESYRALMSEVLPSCGDQPTQVSASRALAGTQMTHNQQAGNTAASLLLNIVVSFCRGPSTPTGCMTLT